MSLKSLIFKYAVKKFAPKLMRSFMGGSGRYGRYGYSGYGRGPVYPAYGYVRKPKSRGVLGLVKRALKKIF
jgi:hypothetical protein